MHLEILGYHPNAANRLGDLKNIFFENAEKAFDSNLEKELFFDKWAGIYIKTWPNDVYFCCDSTTNQTLGYLLGCRDTLKARKEHGDQIAYYEDFSKLYALYPAHLHINMSANARAKGAGTFLIQEYMLDIKKSNSRGAHAVTKWQHANNSFYTKNLFEPVKISGKPKEELVFFGIKLGWSLF